MKYTNEIEIELPLAEVISKFDSTENLKHWMRGLESFEHLEGTPGEVGAKSKMRFKTRRRELEMVETITSKNLPADFTGTYDAPGVHNIVRNSFSQIDENRTRYTSENEFQFKSMGMKFFAWIMPGAFKKQSQIYMEDFKKFAETGASVSEL